MKPDALVVEVFGTAELRALSERFPYGNAHRYRLRDPDAAPSGPGAMSRYANRSAGDL